MDSFQQYWSWVRLNAAGECRVEEIAVAKTFWERQFRPFEQPVSNAEIQRRLVEQLRDPTASNEERTLAEICLRCYISRQIEQTCEALAEQFGRQGRFSQSELLPFVLNDLEITQPLTLTQVPFPASSFRPLAYKVLQTFNPQKSQLNTWIRRLVERDESLNAFMQERGVYRLTDWSLLNHETPNSLQRKLAGRLSPLELQQAVEVLKAFQLVYKTDRLTQKRTGKKCLAPTPDQLQRMANHLQAQGIQLSAQQVLQQLQTMAQALRQLLRQLPDPWDELVEQQVMPEPDCEDIFLKLYFQEFLLCVDRAIIRVLEERVVYYNYKNPSAGDKFVRGLELFYCDCRKMGEFAPELGMHRPEQVVRFLKLKAFWQDVRRAAIERMDRHDCFQLWIGGYMNLTRLASLDQQIENALNQLVAQVQSEASSPTRSGQSQLSSRLCVYLHYRRHKS